MTKILLTGGAGFIGSAVLPELQQHGYDVYLCLNTQMERLLYHPAQRAQMGE